MSMLRIFRPEDDATPSPQSTTVVAETATAMNDESEPVFLNFEEWSRRLRGDSAMPLHRSRKIHVNCQCPECRSALVVPLVLNNGRQDRSGDEVPGTATLVGFRCDVCLTEWPA